jgi:hypothetical protein
LQRAEQSSAGIQTARLVASKLWLLQQQQWQTLSLIPSLAHADLHHVL